MSMHPARARFHLDVALPTVATYRIPMTMGERGAVAAARDLGTPAVIPMHLALEPRLPLLRTRLSAAGFAKRVPEAGLTARIVILAPGGSWAPDRRERGQPPGGPGG